MSTSAFSKREGPHHATLLIEGMWELVATLCELDFIRAKKDSSYGGGGKNNPGMFNRISLAKVAAFWSSSGASRGGEGGGKEENSSCSFEGGIVIQSKWAGTN